MNAPRIGCLFSGYGGLSMAVQQVYPDAEHAWFCEFDAAPSKILAHHWPTVPNFGDITAVDWAKVAKDQPVDILTGGFPCQDVSVAGRRAGMTDGTRSGLWSHMVKAIDVLRPGLVVIENVGGLFSATADSRVEPCDFHLGDTDGGGHTVLLRALDSVLGTLSVLGYDAQWTALRASDVGAPHGRLRVFITAHPAGIPWRGGNGDGGAAPHPGGGGGGGRAAVAVAGGTGGPDVAPVGADARPDAPGGAPGLTLLPTPAVNDMGAAYTPDQWDEWTDRMKAAHGNGNGHGRSLSVEAQRLLPTPEAKLKMLPTPTVDDAGNITRDSGSFQSPTRSVGELIPTPSVADAMGGHERRGGARGGELLLKGMAKEGHLDRFGPYTTAIHRWERVLGRPAPAPTEPGRTRPRLAAPFVEWMMGLPAGHVTAVPGLTWNQQLKALGNGVVPQQGAAAVAHLIQIAHLEGTSHV